MSDSIIFDPFIFSGFEGILGPLEEESYLRFVHSFIYLMPISAGVKHFHGSGRRSSSYTLVSAL